MTPDVTKLAWIWTTVWGHGLKTGGLSGKCEVPLIHISPGWMTRLLGESDLPLVWLQLYGRFRQTWGMKGGQVCVCLSACTYRVWGKQKVAVVEVLAVTEPNSSENQKQTDKQTHPPHPSHIALAQRWKSVHRDPHFLLQQLLSGIDEVPDSQAIAVSSV